MDDSEITAYFAQLYRRRFALGIREDLSLHPDWFGRELEITGLFIWSRAQNELSQRLATVKFDVILYNETNPQAVQVPEGYLLFRLYDLQEFPYLAAVRVHHDE